MRFGAYKKKATAGLMAPPKGGRIMAKNKNLHLLERRKKSFLKTFAKHCVTYKMFNEKDGVEVSPKELQGIVKVFSNYLDSWVLPHYMPANYPLLKLVYSDFTGFLYVRDIVNSNYEEKIFMVQKLYSAIKSAMDTAFLCRVNVIEKRVLGMAGKEKRKNA